MAGGLTAGFKVGGTWLDKFYHHIFRTDRRMIGLFDELGLGDRLQWGRPPTAVLRNGTIHRLDGRSSSGTGWRSRSSHAPRSLARAS